jgi:hypothetical protein
LAADKDRAVRVNVVLIDFENVQPGSLAALDKDHFKLLIFVGASQSKVPFEVAAVMQRLGNRAEYIKISGNGPNALDFHIAYCIGHLAAAHPSAFFHIISKDTGFDPLIKYLKSRKIFAGRSKAIDDIPCLKTATSTSPEERLDIVIDRLRRLNAAKPRTLKTLSSTVASLFQKTLEEEEVSALVKALHGKGFIVVTGSKVSYALPPGG